MFGGHILNCCNNGAAHATTSRQTEFIVTGIFQKNVLFIIVSSSFGHFIIRTSLGRGMSSNELTTSIFVHYLSETIRHEQWSHLSDQRPGKKWLSMIINSVVTTIYEVMWIVSLLPQHLLCTLTVRNFHSVETKCTIKTMSNNIPHALLAGTHQLAPPWLHPILTCLHVVTSCRPFLSITAPVHDACRAEGIKYHAFVCVHHCQWLHIHLQTLAFSFHGPALCMCCSEYCCSVEYSGTMQPGPGDACGSEPSRVLDWREFAFSHTHATSLMWSFHCHFPNKLAFLLSS